MFSPGFGETLALKALQFAVSLIAQKSTAKYGEGCGRLERWTLDIAIFGIFGKRMY